MLSKRSGDSLLLCLPRIVNAVNLLYHLVYFLGFFSRLNPVFQLQIYIFPSGEGVVNQARPAVLFELVLTGG